MPIINGHVRAMGDGTFITSYTNTVGTTYETFSFDKEQETITIHNKGNKNIIYKIGSQVDVTLTPNEKHTVSEKVTSFEVKASESVQRFEIRSDESGNQFKDKALKNLSDEIKTANEQLAENATDIEGRGINLINHGIVADGTTDQTTALIALFEGEFLDYRGKLHIPYNTKFDTLSVYPKIPIGVVLWDESQINYSNTTGYKNKFINIVSSDRTNDDTGLHITSGHHPALFLNNLGTAKEEDGTSTPSSIERKTSILFGGGIKTNKNPLLGNIFQHYVSNNKWVMGFRNYTKFLAPDTTTDSTIFQLDEDGNLCIGQGAGADPTYALKVKKTDGVTLNAMFENTMAGSDVYLRLRNKKDDGTVQTMYLRYDKNGLFSVRDSANNSLMTVTATGEVKGFGGINGNSFTTTGRPTSVVLGTMIFDTTLGKPVWYKGSSQWVDATGTVV